MPSLVVRPPGPVEYSIKGSRWLRERQGTQVGEAAISPTQGHFHFLSAEWKRAKALLSSSEDITNLRAHKEIVAMGMDAVPLILSDLAAEPDFWFPALSAITGANPVRPNHLGDIEAMAEDWLEWGRARGLY